MLSREDHPCMAHHRTFYLPLRVNLLSTITNCSNLPFCICCLRVFFFLRAALFHWMSSVPLPVEGIVGAWCECCVFFVPLLLFCLFVHVVFVLLMLLAWPVVKLSSRQEPKLTLMKHGCLKSGVLSNPCPLMHQFHWRGENLTWISYELIRGKKSLFAIAELFMRRLGTCMYLARM